MKILFPLFILFSCFVHAQDPDASVSTIPLGTQFIFDGKKLNHVSCVESPEKLNLNRILISKGKITCSSNLYFKDTTRSCYFDYIVTKESTRTCTLNEIVHDDGATVFKFRELDCFSILCNRALIDPRQSEWSIGSLRHNLGKFVKIDFKDSVVGSKRIKNQRTIKEMEVSSKRNGSSGAKSKPE